MKMKKNSWKYDTIDSDSILTTIFIIRNLLNADEIQIFHFLKQLDLINEAGLNSSKELATKTEADMIVASQLKTVESFKTLFNGTCCKASDDTLCMIILFFIRVFPININFKFLTREIYDNFASQQDINQCFDKVFQYTEDKNIKELLKANSVDKLASFLEKKTYNSSEIEKIQDSIHNLMVKGSKILK